MAVASALLAVAASLVYIARHAEPYLRARIVSALATHFHARVQLDSFKIDLGYGLHGEWGLWAQGRGLSIWPSAPTSMDSASLSTANREPLIRLDSFRFHVPLRLQTAAPLHINAVRLQGLQIHIPPRQPALHRPPHNPPAARSAPSPPPFQRIRIGSIQCFQARLTIESSMPGKLPLVFNIAHLTLDSISPNGSMRYQAELSNPRPPGLIQSSGTFGPWIVEDPGDSPVTGSYSFNHADLSVFHGIAGILSSTGSFQGVLRQLVVDGQTDTPDFRLTRAGNPMPLHTRFHAIVDGTNGDTRLEPVQATLGHSEFTASGTVVRVRPADSPALFHGHDIDLKVAGSNARVEDMLRLATSGPTPLLTGHLAFNASLHIAPGPDSVQQRLVLNGHFDLLQAEFASDKIQQRIRELSLRAQGEPGKVKSADSASVQSAMHSDFSMANGIITLPNLDYTVPGADIRLHGTYAIDGGALRFDGDARMQATVSQMVGGWKGFLLKAADPLFKKDGAGAQFPVHIGGTRENPSFSVDFNRLKSTSPVMPGNPPQSPGPP